MIENKPRSKTWLCACGFKGKHNFCINCPIFSRQGVQAMFSLTVSRKWEIYSADVKTALFQGNLLEQNVLVRPLKDAQTDKILKLYNCIYGLADASQCCYPDVNKELGKVEARPFKIFRFSFSLSDFLFFFYNLYKNMLMLSNCYFYLMSLKGNLLYTELEYWKKILSKPIKATK